MYNAEGKGFYAWRFRYRIDIEIRKLSWRKGKRATACVYEGL